MRRRRSAAAGQETKVALLTRELNQAVEQQAATAKVLQVISSSTSTGKQCSMRWSRPVCISARPIAQPFGVPKTVCSSVHHASAAAPGGSVASPTSLPGTGRQPPSGRIDSRSGEALRKPHAGVRTRCRSH
jgi:hypothetical protein